MPMPRNTPERLRATWSDRYVVSDRGCHEWSGTRRRGGYGKLTVNYRTVGAHRLAYELFVGPIPDGMVVMHECDNPCCVNPAHLKVGTQSDNMRDRQEKDRNPQRPRLDGPEWPLRLRRLAESGRSLRDLGRQFGVTGVTIGNTIRREFPDWKYPAKTQDPLLSILLRKLNQRGITQARLAKKFGMSQRHVSNLINR